MRREERNEKQLANILLFLVFVTVILIQRFLYEEAIKDFSTRIISDEVNIFESFIRKRIENDIEEGIDSIVENQAEIKEEKTIWKKVEGKYIQKCTTDRCKLFETLEDAKENCLKNDDCFGITGINDEFILRRGPKLVESPLGENSWVYVADLECSEIEHDIFLDLQKLEENYPALKGIKRRNRVTNKCFYPGYQIVNSIIRFNPNLKPKILTQPDNCHFSCSEKISLIFGIKTMPQSALAREKIRKTWLRKDIWEWLGVQIKIVFLIGRPSKENALQEEIEKHKDILMLDMEESHHGLPFKGIAFLNFIKQSCSSVEFVFKGDDDILLIPQNLKKEIDKLKDSKVFEALAIPGFPVFPLDDVYIGSLMVASGMREKAQRSNETCNGILATNAAIQKNDFCALRQVPVAHKVTNYTALQSMFQKVVSVNLDCEKNKEDFLLFDDL
ncbi:Oidioi.mRNA.OKI2018_I69.PAR.g9805.t1.cds [Oikopleura dioica]|uniref:Hexosyltransferase n=1 Tax=Oikopleura dioica TaxID=34765 RepID=A0ABN7RT74_OIKDI|nr:Oidioi.mRNA.OKI2018_I69.PAR.g9805.t1.cds [Oikopleura dioica]